MLGKAKPDIPGPMPGLWSRGLAGLQRATDVLLCCHRCSQRMQWIKRYLYLREGMAMRFGSVMRARGACSASGVPGLCSSTACPPT